MDIQTLTKRELENRIARFSGEMNKRNPDWDTAIIISRVNQYYFLGTMQDGMLIIKKDGTLYYFARRSYERAMDESPFAENGYIYPMESYRDAKAVIGANLGSTYIESEVMTCAVADRLGKHFTFTKTGSLDRTIFAVRAVKSDYELAVMEEAGRRHNLLLQEAVPVLLHEGISEALLAGKLYAEMMSRGHQGLNRFFMFQTEMGIGQIAFGESSLYPTGFDGPGGSFGMYAAVPVIGSYDRRLKKGDTVFVDIGFGMYGYHSDKTQLYIYGAEPSDKVKNAHSLCIRIQKEVASRLKTGAVPSEIYRMVTDGLTEKEKENLGGFGSRRVKFLAHGIGLQVDEYPVIAEGFDEPLETNMLFAIEPKKGIAGIGMVGVEDTFVVTPEGGRCITGGCSDIIIV
ncbi:MAG: peptidase M24 [Firmicutes bacterium HGW-Firmicutes-21]|nr:MAG: peptidase M24 [Firmicutes bacterium HGW-Firmicutes-21]